MLSRRILLSCVVGALTMFAARADEPQAKPARDPRTLRVMTYNIHVGQGMDKRFDLGRIANVIKAADVDVVAVQEVDIKARRSGGVDQLAQLKRLTGMHGVFGKARDYDGGEYGQVILSRKPIQKMNVHQLPGAADLEQRIALVARIEQEKPLPELLFVATHLHHMDEEHRLKQSAALNRVLKDHVGKREPAVLLLGDLNATPDSEVMKRMAENWEDATRDAGLTFPADKPDRKIDYVLLPKGHGWDVLSAKVIDEPVASDHRPVVVELKWAVGPAARKANSPLDAPKHTPIARLAGNASRSVKFNRDGSVLLTAGGCEVRAWDVRTRKPLIDVIRTDSDVFTAQISADGTHLMLRDKGGIQVWDLRAATPIGPRVRHSAGMGLWQTEISPDGSRVLTVPMQKWQENAGSNPADQREVRIWDAASGKLVLALEQPGYAGFGMFSPDGRRIVTLCSGETIVEHTGQLWDAASGARIGDPIKEVNPTTRRSVAFSADGRRFAVGQWTSAQVFDSETGRHILTVDGFWHRGIVDAVFLPRNGEQLFANGNLGDGLRGYDVATGERLGCPETPTLPDPLSMTADGKRCLLMAYPSIGMWDIPAGRWLWSVRPRGRANNVATSPDGTHVVIGTSEAAEVYAGEIRPADTAMHP